MLKNEVGLVKVVVVVVVDFNVLQRHEWMYYNFVSISETPCRLVYDRGVEDHVWWIRRDLEVAVAGMKKEKHFARYLRRGYWSIWRRRIYA
jgi:hypothetical protein